MTSELTMDPATLHTAVRRFPLLGRPRLACPALTDRVAEIARTAATAQAQGAGGMAEAAHALNKAALIASDCGLPHLARTWCWQHINLYRQLEQLTVLQASYLLEPVLNLARLQIRAQDGHPACQLLHAMYRAVATNTDLIVECHTLPLANLSGTRDDLRQLHHGAGCNTSAKASASLLSPAGGTTPSPTPPPSTASASTSWTDAKPPSSPTASTNNPTPHAPSSSTAPSPNRGNSKSPPP